MNTIHPAPTPPGKPWSRPYLIQVLQTAIAEKEFRFARQAGLTWLASYPGDLEVKFLWATSLIGDGLGHQAIPVLEDICDSDPEYHAAQALLDKTRSMPGLDGVEASNNHSDASGDSRSKIHPKDILPKTPLRSRPLKKIQKAIHRGDFQTAEAGLPDLLGADLNSPLVGITHLDILRAQPDTPKQVVRSLAEHYAAQWPKCLHFTLVLADALMDTGESEVAVAKLHQAVSQDLTGQVATRLWGETHPYQTLWPEHIQTWINLPIPASVSGALGWNLLPTPTKQILQEEKVRLDEPENKPETNAESDHRPSENPPELGPKNTEKPVETELPHPPVPPEPISPPPETPVSTSEMREKVNRTARRTGPDGRFPVYVIFSTRTGLFRKYGRGTSEFLEKEMQKLVAVLRKRLDWGATLLFADDPACMAKFDLKPAQWDDPWKLKLALADLDSALAQRGARIGAVLIVGGPDVVPFHHLPNSTDDDDDDVPSDSPYGTRDENYFIPEWPVGRLPGGRGRDPGLLISSLREMAARHANSRQKEPGLASRFINWLRTIFQNRKKKGKESFGYSAEAWHRASISVFKPIGESRALLTSPPITIHKRESLPPSKLGYFNLHGVADSAEWFGQRDSSTFSIDPENISSEIDYPVALHPQDVVNGGRAPEIVFSEACYGTHILGKSIEDALALKFLASGTRVVVGSTVISYGSVAPPLNAADLLGKAFWNYLAKGHAAGEALRRAKIYLASEMDKRQGYLDGEDQKTLISFVLYGDPMATISDPSGVRKKKKLADSIPETPPDVKTVCDRSETPGTSEPIPEEIMIRVKKVVEQYLPGMRDAQLSMSHEHAHCDCRGHCCPTSQLGAKSLSQHIPNRRVVTLSKQVVLNSHRSHTGLKHAAFARLTFDPEGKVVKLAVSR